MLSSWLYHTDHATIIAVPHWPCFPHCCVNVLAVPQWSCYNCGCTTMIVSLSWQGSYGHHGCTALIMLHWWLCHMYHAGMVVLLIENVAITNLQECCKIKFVYYPDFISQDRLIDWGWMNSVRWMNITSHVHKNYIPIIAICNRNRHRLWPRKSPTPIATCGL